MYFSQVNPTSYLLEPNYSPTTSIRLTASIPTGVELVSPTSSTIINPTLSQFDSQSSSTNSASISPSGLAGQTNSASSSPTSPITPANGSSGLSTGAKAGIGVGVTIGVGTLGLIAGFFVFRHRKSHQPVPQVEEYPEPAPVPDLKETHPRPLSELEGSTLGAFKYAQSSYGHASTPSIQDGSAVTYTPGESSPPRLAGRTRLHEME